MLPLRRHRCHRGTTLKSLMGYKPMVMLPMCQRRHRSSGKHAHAGVAKPYPQFDASTGCHWKFNKERDTAGVCCICPLQEEFSSNHF